MEDNKINFEQLFAEQLSKVTNEAINQINGKKSEIEVLNEKVENLNKNLSEKDSIIKNLEKQMLSTVKKEEKKSVKIDDLLNKYKTK